MSDGIMGRQLTEGGSGGGGGGLARTVPTACFFQKAIFHSHTAKRTVKL